MAGLWAEGAYGINVLKFTETLPTVSITSLSSEVLRGLGYWYFYGQDKLQPWTLASEGYTQWPWLIGVSFAVPALCFVMAMLARWRYRAFAVGLILVGTVLAVGAYPYSNPTPFGSLIKTAGSDSTLGLAMRSTNRIVPLVILGLASSSELGCLRSLMHSGWSDSSCSCSPAHSWRPTSHRCGTGHLSPPTSSGPRRCRATSPTPLPI